jgi:lipopolysaccharide transport system permease protein
MGHRRLVNELARREMTDVHAGQVIGGLWAIIHPIVYFLIFAVLFTGVFKVRIGERGPSDYMVYLFAGLAPWLMTQDVFARATTIMFANSTIVKKVMFPPEALVAKSLLASLKIQSILIFIVLLYTIIAREHVSIIIILLPFLYIMHVILLWGFALFLSAMTPYFRDLSELVRIFLVANVYLIPIMYIPNMAPQALRFELEANPFSHLIWCYQDVFYFEAVDHPWSWAVLAAMSVAALVLGSYVFVRLRNHFGSVV